MDKPRVLFVYDIPDERYWKDGLWAAIKLLENDFSIVYLNLGLVAKPEWKVPSPRSFDFVLGWGGFNSSVDNTVQEIYKTCEHKGLCLAGYGFPPSEEFRYDVIFYETDWSRQWLLQHSSYRPEQLVHAFGVNTNLFFGDPEQVPIWDYITVGAFSAWKRQTKLLEKPGYKLAVGQIQINNIHESMSIVADLLLGGVAVSDQVLPEKLGDIYRASEVVYIPAHVTGGGERAVLEARSCGIPVGVEDDNSKLKELLTCPIWTEKYYMDQIKKGILACL